MSGRAGRRRGQHISVQGARFNGGAGGIRVGGDINADVTASIGDGAELRSAVEVLVWALRHDAVAGEASVADVADELEHAVQQHPVSRQRLRELVRRLEGHPVVTSATVAAALQAVQLAAGGGG